MGIVAVDDRDPSVVYSTGWAQAGMSLEYNSTTTWTGVAGSTASISFVGSSIGVYGTVLAKAKDTIAPASVYTIDGGTPVIFRADQTARLQYHQLFFQSPTLPEAAHVLTIMFAGEQADPLFLDFFMVNEATLPASSLTTSSSSSSSVSLSTSTSTTTTPPTAVTVTITSTQDTSTSSSVTGLVANASSSPAAVSGASKSNVAAAVGGIIGGIVVLLLAVFAFLSWRRRRAKRASLYNFRDPNGTFWRRPILDDPPSPVRQPVSLNTPPPPPAPVMSQYTGGQYGDGYYPGGYAPASAYNNYQQQQQQHQPAHSTYNYDSSEENGAYGGVAPSPQPYPQQGYIPPSQLLKPAVHNDDMVQ